MMVPFAQSDVVVTFINGYDKNILNGILSTINESEVSNTCNNKGYIRDLVVRIQDLIEGYLEENHRRPIINTVVVAPKEELDHMAEMLVNLTSFRMKLLLDSYSQIVGGPIDVAVITKGNGLI
ncbi:hypothetical protein [Clostridium sp.]|uniref:hypothetical protein n=1 Tax=Clostridium sp. TaxID=1506 RepID=UPI003217E2B0